MKKNLIIFIFCLMMTGCKKDTFDYRSKFIGDYNFTIQEHSVYGITPVTIHDTTFTNEGKIENGTDKNSVLISSQSFSLQAIIYEDGTLEGYWNNNGKGEFLSTKEMKFFWGYSSPASSTSYNITGDKK